MSLLNGLIDQKPRQIAARVLQRRDSGDFVENLLEQALAPSSSSSSSKLPGRRGESPAQGYDSRTRSRTKNEDDSPQPLSPKDRALCQELVYGVVRWQAALDWLIARKTTPGRNQKPALQNLLRLGLYQIFWLDRIPNHAAVNETVEQAKQSGFGPQAGFVNALLRGYLREFDATKTLLAELKTKEPHIGYSHPEWLVNRWQKRWGAGKAAQLMDWNNVPPKTYARINTLKFQTSPVQDVHHPPKPEQPEAGRARQLVTPKSHAGGSVRAAFDTLRLKDPGSLLTQWRDENIDYDFVRHDWFEENLVFEFKSHPPLARLASFQQGYFYIQDPSTLLAVWELSPHPGETILDLCAAPGGKLTYIAQLMRNEGHLVAHDTSEDRLKLIEENCTRLGVTCAETVSNSKFKNQNSKFDKILLDAPCSNTGVMRRRVDLRWRIRPEEIDRLRATQLDLLRQAAAHLKPGGTLVYSTCSLEPEENQDVVEEFLRTDSSFRLETQRELLPFTDATDGAYIANLMKI
jgi:16S rRNA (cytosine967-C5)-methyltransferase